MSKIIFSFFLIITEGKRLKKVARSQKKKRRHVEVESEKTSRQAGLKEVKPQCGDDSSGRK